MPHCTLNSQGSHGSKAGTESWMLELPVFQSSSCTKANQRGLIKHTGTLFHCSSLIVLKKVILMHMKCSSSYAIPTKYPSMNVFTPWCMAAGASTDFLMRKWVMEYTSQHFQRRNTAPPVAQGPSADTELFSWMLSVLTKSTTHSLFCNALPILHTPCLYFMNIYTYTIHTHIYTKKIHI